jgi:hypothetical protein
MSAPGEFRDIMLFLPGEPLLCPACHKIHKDVWLIGEEPSGGQRCKHMEPPRPGQGRGSGVECGLLVYWMLFPGGMKLAAAVTSREIHEMEEKHMTVAQIRDFLGLRWASLRRRAA